MIVLAKLLLSSAMALTLQTENEGIYRKAGFTDSKTLKAGEQLQIESGDQLLFQAEDQMPILVVVPRSSSDKIEITAALQKEVLTRATQKYLNQAVKDLAQNIQEIQKHIKNRKVQDAHAAIKTGIEKFPGVASFYFMQGTTFYLENNKSAAIDSLEKGLQIDSTDLDAQRLLKKLKGTL